MGMRVEEVGLERLARKGYLVVILGGDLDLLVQNLVVPPRITHNVFVTLSADGNNKSSAGEVGGSPSASVIPLDLCANSYRRYLPTI